MTCLGTAFVVRWQREAHEKASKGLAELASAVESLKQDVAVDYGPDHAFFAFKGYAASHTGCLRPYLADANPILPMQNVLQTWTVGSVIRSSLGSSNMSSAPSETPSRTIPSKLPARRSKRCVAPATPPLRRCRRYLWFSWLLLMVFCALCAPLFPLRPNDCFSGA